MGFASPAAPNCPFLHSKINHIKLGNLKEVRKVKILQLNTGELYFVQACKYRLGSWDRGWGRDRGRKA